MALVLLLVWVLGLAAGPGRAALRQAQDRAAFRQAQGRAVEVASARSAPMRRG